MTLPPTSEAAGLPSSDMGAIRDRIAAGAAALAFRGIALRILGFLASIALARLLAPAEFGAITISLSAVALGSLLAGGGFGAALIREEGEPEPAQLRSLLGFSLAVGCFLLLVAAAASTVLPYPAALVALMFVSLPIVAFRAPGMIVMERQLRYRQVAQVEVGEAVVMYVGSVILVAAGMGTAGVAAAVVMKAIGGSMLAVRLSGTGWMLPSSALGPIRPLFRFGVSYQAVPLASALRDYVVNVAVGIAASLDALGWWGIALRLLQVPYLLFESLWRVSYPAMVRLANLGRDPGRTVSVALRVVSIGAGMALVPVIAAAPSLVVGLFGPAWGPASDAVVLGGIGLCLAGPISVAASGFLLARGRAGRVLVSVSAGGIAWLGVVAALGSQYGVAAVGGGWLVSSLVQSILLLTTIGGAIERPALRSAAASMGAAIVSALAGLGVTTILGPSALAGLLGAGSGLLLFVLASHLTDRDSTIRLRRLATTRVLARTRA